MMIRKPVRWILGAVAAGACALVLAPSHAIAGEPAKTEPAKTEAPKTEAPKADAAHDAAPKHEAIEAFLKVGQEAPRFGPMKTLNAAEAGIPSFVLGNYVGDDAEDKDAKVVLVSFFATWCGPCKKELPFLVELHAKYRARGLRMVSVAIDKEPEALKQIQELIAANKVVHPVISDRTNLLARRYLGEKTAMPSVFLVKKDGTVGVVKQGYDGDASTFLVSEIEKLIGG